MGRGWERKWVGVRERHQEVHGNPACEATPRLLPSLLMLRIHSSLQDTMAHTSSSRKPSFWEHWGHRSFWEAKMLKTLEMLAGNPRV